MTVFYRASLVSLAFYLLMVGALVSTGCDGRVLDNPVRPAGFDIFGPFFDVALLEEATELAYILHRGDDKDPGPDQFLNLALDGYEAWQVQGADPEAPYVLPIRGAFGGNELARHEQLGRVPEAHDTRQDPRRPHVRAAESDLSEQERDLGRLRSDANVGGGSHDRAGATRRPVEAGDDRLLQ